MGVWPWAVGTERKGNLLVQLSSNHRRTDGCPGDLEKLHISDYGSVGRNCISSAHRGGLARHWWALSWPHDITTAHCAQPRIPGGCELRCGEASSECIEPAFQLLFSLPNVLSALPATCRGTPHQLPLTCARGTALPGRWASCQVVWYLSGMAQSLAFKRQPVFSGEPSGSDHLHGMPGLDPKGRGILQCR
nr:uncharacterized protein LOC121825420 isoform X2 [Peromyscus maniculatus bairdii]